MSKKSGNVYGYEDLMKDAKNANRPGFDPVISLDSDPKAKDRSIVAAAPFLPSMVAAAGGGTAAAGGASILGPILGAGAAGAAGGFGAGAAGGMFGGGGPNVPTVHPWQIALSGILAIPDLIRGWQMSAEMDQLRGEWKKKARPENYWGQGVENKGFLETMGLDTGVKDFLNAYRKPQTEEPYDGKVGV